MKSRTGAVEEVYFEELRSGGRAAGRTADGKLVLVEGSEELLGTLRDVEIERATLTTLLGRIV
jgi:tRNA-2-methylthio-N6-dimethylallyladenosine synthase